MKLKLQKSLTEAEWEEIVKKGPGVRMYNGKKTLFYNGEILCDGNRDPVVHNEEERNTWQVIIILPGVEVISYNTFSNCRNVETVIMADGVQRIEEEAFLECHSLAFIKLSRNLEYIGNSAFFYCNSLTSVFIPPSCREIADYVFDACEELIILSIPPHTELGRNVITSTALIEASTFETDEDGFYSDPMGGDDFYYSDTTEVNAWIKSINDGETLALHRICSSDNPDREQVYGYMKDHGLRAMNHPNSIGFTPSQYLAANPYSEIEESDLVKKYILEMMGEFVQET